MSYWDKYQHNTSKKSSYNQPKQAGYGNSYEGYYNDDYYDNYYDDYYRPKKQATSYNSSYSYSWLENTPDTEYDSPDICIQAHPNYITPSGSTIREKWKPLKYDFSSNNNKSYYGNYYNYNYDNGYDLTQEDENLVREFARYFFWRSVDDKDYFKPGYNQEVISNKEPFYDSLWQKDVPGQSPTEMAVNLFYELKHQQEEEKKNKQKKQGDGSEEEGDGDGDKTPASGKPGEENKKAAKSVAEMIQKGVPKVDFEMSDFQNPIIQEMMNSVKKLGNISNKTVMRSLSVIDDFGDQFSIEKEIQSERVASSHQKELTRLKKLADLTHAQKFEFLRPDYQLRLIKRAIRCEVPVQYKERKQKIVILLDYSGSMATPVKQKWVVSLLVDRCQAVIEGKAEIYFSYFVHDKDRLKFTHLHDKKSVMDFLGKFSTEPNGGGTAIGTIANYVGECIKEGRLPGIGKVDFSETKYKPEVLIINDGQDRVDSAFSFKTNALSLIDGFNQQLMEYCIKSGGKYIFLDGDGQLDHYTRIPTHKGYKVSHGR